jgi:hypothetical protein
MKIDQDTLMRAAAFEQIRKLGEIHDHLTANELKSGFIFENERIPLVNPQRGIFKPRQMQFLLSIKTVFPKAGARVWYDDQREVHRQIFEGDETVDYAFMGKIRMQQITDGCEKLLRTRYRLSTSSVSHLAAMKRFCRRSFPDGMQRL